MKLVIGEAYSTDDYCFPILEIEINNIKELPNISYLNDKKIEIEMEEMEFPYIINFTHGFFDSLSTDTLDTLNEIYSLFDNDYLSSKMWVYYTVISEIELPPIKKVNKVFNIFTNTKNTNEKLKVIKKKFPHLNRTTNKIAKSIFFPYDVDIYRYHYMLSGYQTGYLLANEIVVKNEMELLYSFMDFIFNSKYNYYIKKCERCNKFYISNKSDTKYCSRFDTEDKTCKQNAVKHRLQYGNLEEYERVDKRVREYFRRQNYTVNDDFLNAYSTFRTNNPNRTAEEQISFLENYKNDYLLSLKKL